MPSYACNRCGLIGPKPFCPDHEPDHRSPSSRVTGTRRWREHTKPAVLKGGKTCVYCGAPATVPDHVLAVSKGGAKHDPANLVPACVDCNAAKGDR